MKHGTCVKDVLIYFWFSLFVPVEWLNKQTTEIVLRYLTLCLILGTVSLECRPRILQPARLSFSSPQVLATASQNITCFYIL